MAMTRTVKWGRPLVSMNTKTHVILHSSYVMHRGVSYSYIVYQGTTHSIGVTIVELSLYVNK